MKHLILIISSLFVLDSSYSSGSKAPNQRINQKKLEEAGLERRQADKSPTDYSSGSACDISSGAACPAPAPIQIAPPRPAAPPPAPPPPRVRHETQRVPPASTRNPVAPSPDQAKTPQDSAAANSPRSPPQVIPQNPAPSPVAPSAPEIVAPPEEPTTGPASTNPAPSSEVAGLTVNRNEECTNGVCTVPGPLDNLAQEIQDAASKIQASKEAEKGCAATESDPSVIDTLSRVFLPDYTLTYSDGSGSGRIAANVVSNDLTKIRPSSLDTYYDNLFPKRTERLSIINCQNNRLNLSLNNGFTLTLDNSKDPLVPIASCTVKGQEFRPCRTFQRPTYIVNLLSGKNNGQPYRELLRLIRSTISKIQKTHPNCAPFNQYNVSTIDNVLNNNSNLYYETIAQIQLPLGIEFVKDSADLSYRNITRAVKRAMMDIACK